MITLIEYINENPNKILFNCSGLEKHRASSLLNKCTKKLLDSSLKITDKGEIHLYFNAGFLGSRHKWCHFFNLNNDKT